MYVVVRYWQGWLHLVSGPSHGSLSVLQESSQNQCTRWRWCWQCCVSEERRMIKKEPDEWVLLQQFGGLIIADMWLTLLCESDGGHVGKTSSHRVVTACLAELLAPRRCHIMWNCQLCNACASSCLFSDHFSTALSVVFEYCAQSVQLCWRYSCD